MNKAQKIEFVQELSERLAEAPLLILTDYRTITVAEVNKLRREFEEKGVEYRVVKNSLLKRALMGTDKEGLVEYLTGMTGVILSGEDPIAAAKAARAATKELQVAEKFTVKGGYFDGDVLDGTSISKVADYLGKDELLSMLLRTLQEGPRQTLGVIQAPARDLLFLLKNHEMNLSEGADA